MTTTKECKDFLVKSGLDFAELRLKQRKGVIVVDSIYFFHQIIFVRKGEKYNFNRCLLGSLRNAEEVSMPTKQAIKRILHEYNVLKGN